MPLWKRSADICCCLAAMPVLILAIIMMAIFHTIVSPGPLFFRQARVGYRGRRFQIYKFRTMKPDSDSSMHQNYSSQFMASAAPMEKLDAKGDARIIPGGWLLRAAGWDELPQLLNVLLGDMSLVGPRPCLPYEYEAYTPAQRRRLEVAPGLTGLWQVSGKNRTTFEQMVRLDSEYVDRRTAGLDLKIILLTIPALVRQIADMQKAKSLAGRAAAHISPLAMGTSGALAGVPRK